MGARRSPWVGWGAGALLLFAVALLVFWAALRQERSKPPSMVGAGGFESGDPRRVSENERLRNLNRRSPDQPGIDPHVQETLHAIEEINRINRMNQDLRRKVPPPGTPPKPVVPASPRLDGATVQEDEPSTDNPKRPVNP